MTDKKLTDVTDNKVGEMTDNEIKGALECCILGDCQGCFYGETDQRHCKDDLMQNALDLITRQQAEIERLEKEKDEYAYLYEKHINTAFSHIKAEAYKEFADELKCRTHEISYNTMQVVNKDDINNLLKELVGEDK